MGYIVISLEVKQTMEIIDNPILDDRNSLIKKIVDLVNSLFFFHGRLGDFQTFISHLCAVQTFKHWLGANGKER